MRKAKGRTAAPSCFELRHLRYFVALAKERNFERAAANLGIAQPGLSQQIIALEAIVGMPLIDRNKRGVHLTISGELLLAEATKILSQSEVTLATLRRVGRGETGRISIGYVASAAYSGAVVETISRYRQAYPEVHIKLVEMELRQQLARIAEGDLDFGYIRSPAQIPAGVVTHVVLKEPLIAVLPTGHPLAIASGIALSALSEETFLTPRQPADVGFHHNTITACQSAGFNPHIDPLGLDFTEIASLVAVGFGVALVPKSFEVAGLPGVQYLQLSDCRTTSDLAVAYRKTETSPAVRAFVSHSRRLGGSATAAVDN